jgi:spore coat protein U domain-containing protein, fimbrial subunit CupE1/2/3/6
MTRLGWRLGVILALAPLTGAGGAAAAIRAASFQVSAGVAPVCTIVTSDLAFGAYDPLVANARVGLDAEASVTVTCTRAVPGAVAVDGGLYGGRRMASGAQRLAYQIYKDASHATVWQAGPEGGVAIVGGGATQPERVTLFGRIPPGQVVLSGRYTDSITATVQF